MASFFVAEGFKQLVAIAYGVGYATADQLIASLAAGIVDAAGEGHFYGHGVESAHMADAALRRLKSDRRTREAVVWLVAMHDQTLPGGRAGARRLLSRYGIARTRQLLQMRIADHAAHNPAYPERGDEIRTDK